jgi:tryptophan synthase alpha chain
MTTRIAQCFEAAASKNRAVLGVFVTAGDPDAQTSAALLDSLVENGADFIELGMPFSTRWQMAQLFKPPAYALSKLV